MKPSEQCKAAGLRNLKELSSMTRQSDETLINWSRNKPELFAVVIAGAVALKAKSNG